MRTLVGWLMMAAVGLGACVDEEVSPVQVGGGGAGAGGSTASGGSIAAGGSIAIGGSTADPNTCGPGEHPVTGISLGFDAPLGGATEAVVTGVGPLSLELSFGADAELVHFDWRGPDLTEHFTVGEDVRIEGPDEEFEYVAEWHIVCGAACAATYARQDWEPYVPWLPEQWPQLFHETQCTYPIYCPDTCEPEYVGRVLALVMVLADEEVSIPQGQTGGLGDWHAHNAGASADPPLGNGSRDWHQEGYYEGYATIIGPAPSPADSGRGD